jgi:hypothetical protein
MKVNFEHEFKDENGKPIRLGAKEQALFKDVAVQSLLYAKGKDDPSAAEKKHRYELATRINMFGSETELMDEDIKLLKDCIGNAYHVLVAGPAQMILEGKDPIGFN